MNSNAKKVEILSKALKEAFEAGKLSWVQKDIITSTLIEVMGLDPAFKKQVLGEDVASSRPLLSFSEIAERAVGPQGNPLSYLRVWQIVKEKNIPTEKHRRFRFMTRENFEKFFLTKKK